MRRTAIAAALLVALAGGCKKKDEEKKPARPTGAAAQGSSAGGKTGDRAVGDQRKEMMRAGGASAERVAQLRMLPISVQEVKSALPELPDGKPLGPPTLAMGGRQVRANVCVTGRTTEQVTADLERVLRERGFTDVRTKPHPRDAAVTLVSGEKLPLRTGGSIQRGDFADCPQAQGGTKVSLSYFKRNPDGAAPTEESAADPTR